MAGMIFSGQIDTDILFDYGLFSPGCRWTDLAEFKRLAMKIDLRMPHLTGNRLFPGWNGAMAKFREIGVMLVEVLLLDVERSPRANSAAGVLELAHDVIRDRRADAGVATRNLRQRFIFFHVSIVRQCSNSHAR